MYAQYKSHNDETLSYMEDALNRFHNFNDVSLHGQAGKRAKARANALRMEVVKNQNLDEETNAETWTLAKKRRGMKDWREYISHELDVSK